MPTLHIPVRRRGGRQPKDVPPSKPQRSRSLPRHCKNNDSSSTLTTQQSLYNSWSSFSTQSDEHIRCHDDVVKPLSPSRRLVSNNHEAIPKTKDSSKKVRIVCPPDLDEVLARMQLEPLSQLRSDSCDLHGSESGYSEHSRDSLAPYEVRAIDDYEQICRQFEREY